MRVALLLLLAVPQDDPFSVLIDAGKRANEPTRKAALESFRKAGQESGVHFVAAAFLEKTDKQWKLVNDKNARDPASADLDAFLAKYWSTAPADDKHLEALNSLAALAEKHAKSDACDVFRLFAHAHLNAVGDKGATPAAKLGFTKDADRWTRKEQAALYAIARGFAKPAYIPAQVESAAKSSTQFGPRYIVALLEIQKTFSANTGYEALYKSIPTIAGPGASKPTMEHLKMLAEGLKASTVCGNCKAGKVDCEVCQGKKRTDINCPVCKGLGWSQKGDKANVLIQCVNCRGLCTLKNVCCRRLPRCVTWCGRPGTTTRANLAMPRI